LSDLELTLGTLPDNESNTDGNFKDSVSIGTCE